MQRVTMLVDFAIIGAQKCGTTSLAAQLAGHPEICFCETKEPGYFHQNDDWKAGLESYHRLYRPKEGQICGEASTMYTFLPEWQGTYSRLFAYNPDLKLIYIMRQPVQRVISNYSHNLVRGLVKDTPEAAVFEDPVYINRSRYAVQLRPYLDLFPRENVLLLLFEEYIADQPLTLREIAGFLGISPDAFAQTDLADKHKTVGKTYLKNPAIRAMVGSKAFQAVRPRLADSIRQPIRRRLSNQLDEKPYFSPSLRRDIWRFVEDDVRGVEDLLGRRLDVWRSWGTA
jgi:hypothetical protein